MLTAAAPGAALAHRATRVTSLSVGGYDAKVDALLVRVAIRAGPFLAAQPWRCCCSGRRSCGCGGAAARPRVTEPPPLFATGVAVATPALVSPLDAMGSYLLSAHRLQHVLIGAAVPALILVALRGPLVFFFLPAPILGRLAHLAPLRALASFLLRPRPSLGSWPR